MKNNKNNLNNKYTNTKKLAAGNIDYRGVATNTSLIKYSINELKEGDQILMCTDGITDFVKKDQFKEIAFAKNPMAKYNESI